jgi:hypothetical protein
MPRPSKDDIMDPKFEHYRTELFDYIGGVEDPYLALSMWVQVFSTASATSRALAREIRIAEEKLEKPTKGMR